MGAEPWINFVPYQERIGKALQELRERIFHDRNFRWADDFEGQTIDELLEDAMESGGTASALDVMKIAEEPEMFACAPLSSSVLLELYGTDRPTAAQIEACYFFDLIARGHSYYVITYADGLPELICFAGCSLD